MTVHGLMVWGTVGLALLAGAMIVGFLVRRPPMGTAAKLWLFAGLGVVPIAAAMTGNVVGFDNSTKVDFCNGCHVMVPYVKDARDPQSDSLAAIHTRNAYFGQDACYTCHEDYSMFGMVATKLQGVEHMYEYYKTWRNADPLDPKPEIKLYSPYPVSNCTHCHTMKAPDWKGVQEHQDNAEKLAGGKVTCVNRACHGPPHPVKDAAKERREEASE